MGTQGRTTKRLTAAALVSMATVALAASLAVGASVQTEEKPNYPVFPPRETLAFTDGD